MTSRPSPIMINSWVGRFIGLAAHVATWSKDPSTKVGAVIVDPNTKIVTGLGFNGFPRGIDDTLERLDDREVKYKLVVHAEMNAVLNANNLVRGDYLFTTLPPCHDCTKFLIQAGIARIYTNKNIPDRWMESFNLSKAMFKEAQVPIYLWDADKQMVASIL
jgi:dCMP deaminase